MVVGNLNVFDGLESTSTFYILSYCFMGLFACDNKRVYVILKSWNAGKLIFSES